MHLLPYLSIVLTASAASLPLQLRATSCEEDVQDIEMVTGDGPTADGTAGIGAEFESPFFYFVNPDCSNENTNAAKKEVVAGRTGTNWYLSADTGAAPQKLNAEYILDGKNIKVGSGDGEKAGKAIADDLVSTAATRLLVLLLLTLSDRLAPLDWGRTKYRRCCEQQVQPVEDRCPQQENKTGKFAVGPAGHCANAA